MFTRLLDILFPPRAREVRVRECTREDVLRLLSPTPLTQGGAALLPYREPIVKVLVTEAKFKGSVHAQRLLGEVLRDYLHDWLPDVLTFEERDILVLPVPLSKKRYRERGYNQVEELLRYAEVPVATHILKRTRDTAPQTSLGKRARADNMRGAFEARHVNPQYLYIVVDDVTTTGATLNEAVCALKDAGASRVVPIALAY